MRRRQVLQGVPALALPVAGCGGSSEDATATEPTGADRLDPLQVGETATVEEYGELTVTSLTVQRSVSVDHLGLRVFEPEDAQLIVVDTPDIGKGTKPAPFVPILDGERVEPVVDIEYYAYQPAAALAVPVREVGRAAVVLTRDDEPAWAVPDEQVQRLAAAPEFALQRATFDHETSELTLVVENSGDRDGTFRGGVNFGDDVTTPIQFPVAAGETSTETIELSLLVEPSRDREFDVTADTRVLRMEQ